MKQVPCSLETHASRPGGEIFSGATASLTVGALADGVIEFRYEFERFPIDERIERAAALLYDGAREARKTPRITLSSVGSAATQTDPSATSDGKVRREMDENVPWLATIGDAEVEIERATGVVTVRRGGVRVHGGAIGSPDTVLPRYPVRVHGSAPLHVQGTFNFKLGPEDRFYGLGDKAGSPERRGRRFLMHNRDALGYRASFADPLYKSIPFLIRHDPAAGTWSGIAVTAPGVTTVDLGVESELYYSISLRNGPYRYVLILGDSYREILDRYTWLTGRPAFPPAFTFGFLGSSMDYTEPDDAPERVLQYLDTVEQLGIPCEGLYLSSGYYKSDAGYRHTFEWNTHKFSDPARFIGAIRERSYHISCNVKPGILTTHPRYRQFETKGCLIENADGSAYTEYYWGGDASFWDFSREGAREEWRRCLGESLFDLGVDGVWNDNNEYEIEDSSVPTSSTRSTMALEMCRASYEEMLEHDPERRPWVITRSGGMGIQRYARTWSGDNCSSWESLKFNTLMGFSFGLSGFPFFGHDVGGFYGPRPDAEQFLRWCQAAVFQPRFVIHSWKGDGEQTELWSYGELTQPLLSLVKQHYEFMPYTYSLAYAAHKSGEPLQRSPALEYPEDDALDAADTTYLYGPYLLVAPVVDRGRDSQRIRLPGSGWWYSSRDGGRYQGGSEIELPMPARGEIAGRVPYLIRAGSIVPRAPGASSLEHGWFEQLVIDLYPGAEARFELFEDDGESRLDLGRWSLLDLGLTAADSSATTRIVRFSARRLDENEWSAPRDGSITLTLPPGFRFATVETEERTFELTRGELLDGVDLEIVATEE